MKTTQEEIQSNRDSLHQETLYVPRLASLVMDVLGKVIILSYVAYSGLISALFMMGVSKIAGMVCIIMMMYVMFYMTLKE